MPGRILFFINELRFSYWFVPALMALGAILLSVSTVTLDTALGHDWLAGTPWIFTPQPDGARALLSTIAGSMITVAGVTFSITVVTVASSTNQFGPRLLTNFLSDRGNQITLGTFIATFLYCLLILRSVISPGEGDGEQAFVPNLSLHIALLLAMASVGVLIFFLHHVPQSVHVSHMIARTGHALIDEIDKLYPHRIGDAPADRRDAPDLADIERLFDDACEVPADGHGYLQQIDGASLMDIASKRDLIIRIDRRPGAFVRRGQRLARVRAASTPDEDLLDEIAQAFTWHVKRSPTQDVMFLVDQLVEVAARALSPGLNDPFTAMNCLEWLAAAVAEVAQREMPTACRYDEADKLRIVAEPIDFAELVDAAFGALRSYVARDPNAAAHTLRKLVSIAGDLRTDEQRAVIVAQAAAYLAASELSLSYAADKAEIASLYEAVKRQSGPTRG